MILVVDSCAWLFFAGGYLEISVLAKRAENKNSCTVLIAWVKGKYFYLVITNRWNSWTWAAYFLENNIVSANRNRMFFWNVLFFGLLEVNFVNIINNNNNLIAKTP